MQPATSDNDREAAARAAFGAGLDQLLATWRGRASDADLTAALEGRADAIRTEEGRRQHNERTKRARDLAAARERAVALVAAAVHVHADIVSNMLRGDRTDYESRRPYVLAEAGQHPALQAELASLLRAEEARGGSVLVPTPVAVGPVVAKAAPQPITIGGK